MKAEQNQNKELRKDLEESNNRLKKMEIGIGELKEKGKSIEELNEAEIIKLNQANAELNDALSEEITNGEIAIAKVKNKIIIQVAEKLFFKSGSDKLITNGQASLMKIGKALKKMPEKMICVEGHTDNVPIGRNLRSKHRSNWELSAARAINVLTYLKNEADIDAHRMNAAAFGQYNPIGLNTTEEGKAKNRRIEILVMDTELERLKNEKQP